MNLLQRKRYVMILAAFMLFFCTGCSGMSLDEMKNTGRELLEQGEELNQQLASEAAEANAGIFEEGAADGTDWISVFEKANLRIQYAGENNPEEKTKVDDSLEFVEQLCLEQWELTASFPEDEGKKIFFIQQPVDEEEPDSAYKNIANLRYLLAKVIVVAIIAVVVGAIAAIVKKNK